MKKYMFWLIILSIFPLMAQAEEGDLKSMPSAVVSAPVVVSGSAPAPAIMSAPQETGGREKTAVSAEAPSASKEVSSVAGASVAPVATTGATTAQPIDISAKGLFQWNREGRFYLAKDDAVVKQGSLQLEAEEIKAIYTGDDPQDISTIIVTGGIVVRDPPYQMTAEKGIYDLKAGLITFTGENLELRTASDVVTAKEEMVYRVADNRFTATGDAKALRGQDELRADALFAIFTRDESGELRLRQLQAKQNVRLTNGTEIVTGDEAVYDTEKKAAVLTGAVKLKQGESWLLGNRAEVNLETGISTLFADKKAEDEDGRVRGTFYPQGAKPAGEIKAGEGSKPDASKQEVTP